MYYKFQKLKPGSNKHWEDMNDGSYKADDVETIFRMWKEIMGIRNERLKN